MRISLFGGGTDLDPFCSQHGSTIISFAINRYIYLTWNPRPTGGCRLSYSEVEELETLRDAEHTLVRETAQRHGIPEPCTLTITSDLPKGTGLGSSSALAVCLARLAGHEYTSGQELWRTAGKIEHAHSKAGWQDYLPAVHGCFNIYKLKGVDTPMFGTGVPGDLDDLINTYGLLLYTGNSRPADSVLGSWQKSEEQLHQIKALADKVAGEFACAAERYSLYTLGKQTRDEIPTWRDMFGKSPQEWLGHYLNLTWELKRSISGVSDPKLNQQFALAISNGALGGKLCGAGAGGCWFFLVPPSSRTRANIKQALGLREIPFKIAEKGVESWEL